MDKRDCKDLPGEEFHRKLLESLESACKETAQILQDVDRDTHFLADYELMMPQVQQVALRCTGILDKMEYLLCAMEQRILSLHTEGQRLDAREAQLLQKKADGVSARGHKLLCQSNFHRLESTLADSFVSRERCLSVEAARSFRDGASEKLLRTSDLLRVAALRGCSIDGQLHATMKQMGQAVEKWRAARGEWVETLDNMAKLQRERIFEWLAGPASQAESQRQQAELVLDYQHLLQQKRHLSLQVMQSTLGMCKFNVSLEYDYVCSQREQRLFDELQELQERLHMLMQKPGVHLRAACAATDLLKQQKEQQLEKGAGILPEMPNPQYEDEHLNGPRHEGGRALHRCGKVTDLASQVKLALGKKSLPCVYNAGAEEDKKDVALPEDRTEAVEVPEVEGKRKLEVKRKKKKNMNVDKVKDKDKGSQEDQAPPEGRLVRESDSDNPDISEVEATDRESHPEHHCLVPRLSAAPQCPAVEDGKGQGAILAVKQGSELLAKGDVNPKVEGVPVGSNNSPLDAHNAGGATGRDPFLARLRRRFSFTPRSESMTDSDLHHDLKVKASDSKLSQQM